MSHAIFKYTLPPIQGDHQLTLPVGARILSVGKQDHQLCLWVIFPAAETPKKDGTYKLEPKEFESRHFTIHFTGQYFLYDSRAETYVGTVQVGPLVCHVFEVRKDV